MNSDTIKSEADEAVEMGIQGCNNEEKNMIPGLCMPAGIKTSSVDQNKLQKRHFPNKMGSNIFFCDLPPEDYHVSSENNANAAQDDFCKAAGSDVHDDERPHDDQKLSEKRHFNLPSEDSVTSDENAEQDEQVDSTGAIESTEIETGNEDQKQSGDEQIDSAEIHEEAETEKEDAEHEKTQRRHFHNKTSSDIFFCGLPQ